MKAKIVRPDGTVIRVSGTPEEVADVIARVSPQPSALFRIPAQSPYPWPFAFGYPDPYPVFTTDAVTFDPVGTVNYPSSTSFGDA